MERSSTTLCHMNYCSFNWLMDIPWRQAHRMSIHRTCSHLVPVSAVHALLTVSRSHQPQLRGIGQSSAWDMNESRIKKGARVSCKQIVQGNFCNPVMGQFKQWSKIGGKIPQFIIIYFTCLTIQWLNYRISYLPRRVERRQGKPTVDRD